MQIQPGDLNTPIRIQRLVTTGSGISKTTSWVDLGNTSASDAARYIYASWKGLDGREAWIASSVQAERPATVIIRYRPDVSEQCRIVYGGVNYDIVPMREIVRRAWLEIKVKASVNS